MTRFREARREDVATIVALLRDDTLGAGREGEDLAPYLAAFDLVDRSAVNALIVGEVDGEVVACYQLTFIDGLSLKGARRAQIEGVRVAAARRGEGLGAALLADAEARAREAGCRLIQLTTHGSRERAHEFYERHGFQASHVGLKRALD